MFMLLKCDKYLCKFCNNIAPQIVLNNIQLHWLSVNITYYIEIVDVSNCHLNLFIIIYLVHLILKEFLTMHGSPNE